MSALYFRYFQTQARKIFTERPISDWPGFTKQITVHCNSRNMIYFSKMYNLVKRCIYLTYLFTNCMYLKAVIMKIQILPIRALYNSVKQRGIVTTINVDSNKRVWSDNGHYDSRNRTYLHASRLVPPEQVLVVKNQ